MAQLSEDPSGAPFVKREFIHINKVPFAKQSGVLENEADVNDYVESLRQALLEQIKNNKVINL